MLGTLFVYSELFSQMYNTSANANMRRNFGKVDDAPHVQFFTFTQHDREFQNVGGIYKIEDHGDCFKCESSIYFESD